MSKAAKKDKSFLSKSLFVRGLNCHKSLYLHKYHSELRDPLLPDATLRMETGIVVGRKAQERFPGGIEVPYSKDYADQIEKTKKAIKAGRKTIYEASFSHEGVFVKVDILKKGKKGWNTYEVKSSTKVEKSYIQDAALQYYVLKGAGIKPDRVHIVIRNTDYIKKGALEIEKLFISEDKTDQVLELQPFIAKEVVALKKMLAAKMPDIKLGRYCEKPYVCDFKGHCWKDLPEYSVLFHKGKSFGNFKLYESGAVHISDLSAKNLTAEQSFMLEAFLKKRLITDKKALREFLSTLWYPLYFLDFETFEAPIPIYNGAGTTSKIPFQYSLHSLKKKGGRLYHSEYLAEPGTDHRRELLTKLLSEIPEGACVLAYKQSVEKGALKELAAQFPWFRGAIEKITANIRDLMFPFQNRHVYHYQMKGSYSIKKVLPVLVPKLRHSDLEISDGNMAMVEYARMNSSKNLAEVEEIRRRLIEYCTLDTLGMVRIYEKLLTLAK